MTARVELTPRALALLILLIVALALLAWIGPAALMGGLAVAIVTYDLAREQAKEATC